MYNGPMARKDHSENIPLRIGSKEELWEKMMKEVELSRYVGPFKEVPFNNFIQSPVGLVPKDGGRKTRLIFHLSYNFKASGNKSLNACIPREFCSVHYNDIDAAIECSFRVGSSVRQVFYGKTDVSSAFHLVLLKPSCFWLLVMKVKHPVTGETWYLINKCLPFIASISCAIFQDFSDAIKYIV